MIRFRSVSDRGEEGRREGGIPEGQHWTQTGLLPSRPTGGDHHRAVEAAIGQGLTDLLYIKT